MRCSHISTQKDVEGLPHRFYSRPTEPWTHPESYDRQQSDNGIEEEPNDKITATFKKSIHAQ